ncbi:SMEK domain-containing protein [Pseudomonas sp. RIT778]|uniref:SMEK domain-containing protein n=1 Tax=Pseudomonas sp. RIT778 TaxID=2870471 RepID=UPI001C87DF26|nr:SMEK domain-containing protein [Pseudomonas sp. RIT778]MBX8472110.1 SMEK domain-containing protein [Pseudomonas sp. RIT778]
MNRIDYQKSIIKALSWLKTQVEYQNSLSLTDINHGAEDFYCGLLNLVYGYSLKNINIADPNAAAIDLGDEQNRVAIQVTSTSALSKTRYTVEKFVEKGLHKKFDKLLIINIVKKSNHEAPTIGGSEYVLDTKKDILDVEDLIKKINSDRDLEKLRSVAAYLDAELCLPVQKSLPNEVLTVLGIIEYISDETHAGAGNGYIEEPDPDRKIFKRFQEHSEFLVEMYNDGYVEYGAVLEAVKKESDFGQVKLRRAANYLKEYSDAVLTECGGDPQKALNKIIESFKVLLGGNGYAFDAGAAKFYVIDQLVKCNIFPLKEVPLA